MRLVVAAGLIGVLLAASARARALDPQTPQAPVFRGGTLLVPIDLRVLDRLGQSITGLTAADITVREDSVVQDVKYFSATTLSPERDAVRSPPASRRPPGADLVTPNRRVFLIVLGRGRLQEPAKGLDGLLRFVRERLLPQDLVAVLGYDRATDFTTDHQRVAAVLERFRSRHESIEQNLRTHFSGLAGIYGSKLLPKSIQADIDAVFRAPRETIADRELPPAPGAFQDRLEGDERVAIDAGINLASSSFGDFVSSNRQTMQDVGNLYTGIEYLRHLDGEKHLIFVTEFGFSLPRMEDDRGLAAMAADARVVIDTIQTGGIPGSEVPDARLPAAPLTVAPTRQSVAAAALKTVAELTGGLSSLNEYAATAIDRLNAATRSGYLLGYTPTNSAWDGRFRKISITVDRKDVTVLYRRGYYARAEMLPFDRQQFVTSSRMNAAASFRREIRDIKLNARTSRAAGAPDAVVDVTIDPSRLHFADAAGRRQANLAVALVCLDSAQRVVSQFAEQVGFPLDDAEFTRAAKDGLGYTGRVAVPPQGRTIKVVVYDRAADLIGTIVVPVR